MTLVVMLYITTRFIVDFGSTWSGRDWVTALGRSVVAEGY